MAGGEQQFRGDELLTRPGRTVRPAPRGRAGIGPRAPEPGSRIGLRPSGTTPEGAEPGSPPSDSPIVIIAVIVVILLIIVPFLSEFVPVERRCDGEAAPRGRVSPGFLPRAYARGGEIPGPRG